MVEYQKSPGKQGFMVLRINRVAVDWLRKHIMGPDMLYARYQHEKNGTACPNEACGVKPVATPGYHANTPNPAVTPSRTMPAQAESRNTPSLSEGRTTSALSGGHTTPASSTLRSAPARLSAADEEVLRRVPARALADELVRRSTASGGAVSIGNARP